MPKISSIIAYPPLPMTSGQVSSKKRDREGHTSDSSVATETMSDGYNTDATSVSMTLTNESRPKRKRGRLPTTGQFVGLHAAKQQLEELEHKEMELQAERELEEERANRKADRQQLREAASREEGSSMEDKTAEIR